MQDYLNPFLLPRRLCSLKYRVMGRDPLSFPSMFPVSARICSIWGSVSVQDRESNNVTCMYVCMLHSCVHISECGKGQVGGVDEGWTLSERQRKEEEHLRV